MSCCFFLTPPSKERKNSGNPWAVNKHTEGDRQGEEKANHKLHEMFGCCLANKRKYFTFISRKALSLSVELSEKKCVCVYKYMWQVYIRLCTFQTFHNATLLTGNVFSRCCYENLIWFFNRNMECDSKWNSP